MSSGEKDQKKVSRRRFVRQAATGTAAAVGAGLLAGCSQAPQIVKETVEVPVEVIKEVTVAAPAEVVLTVMNPQGELPPQPALAISPRLSDLAGKTIGLVDNTKIAVNYLFDSLEEDLKAKYPTATILRFRKKGYFDVQPELYEEVAEKCQAFVLAIGD